MLNHRLNFFICLSALACAAPSGSSSGTAREGGSIDTLSSPLATGEYIDARSYLTSDDDINRWYDLTFALRDDFDDICGDTFCEGDYSNYQSLEFSCSVDQASGFLGECSWVFAASIEELERATGRFDVQGRTWQCTLPLAPDTPATGFLQTLTSSDERPLFTPLPNTDATAYDGLIDCL
ncbi:MAG TPA: hypothetical protein VMG12_26420 [Polyangiaceae bacterium]|nr:hypothetical protein [Polyangiaceae bacterium]